MTYVKLKNIKNNGSIDYKGIDISKNIPGSQEYDLDNDFCVFITNSDIPNHPDIEVITEEAYETLKAEIRSKRPKDPVDDRILELQNEVTNLKAISADLTYQLMMKGVI